MFRTRYGHYKILVMLFVLTNPPIASMDLIRSRYGHYELLVILFGLTNAPVASIDLINKEFRPYLNRFSIVFVDNILIYSREERKHEEYILITPQMLQES